MGNANQFEGFSMLRSREHLIIERGIMKRFKENVKQFLVSEDGPTAVEYAVMLALIVIVCLTAIQAVGTNTNAKFQQSADMLT